jgi:hypothetical protein
MSPHERYLLYSQGTYRNTFVNYFYSLESAQDAAKERWNKNLEFQPAGQNKWKIIKTNRNTQVKKCVGHIELEK